MPAFTASAYLRRAVLLLAVFFLAVPLFFLVVFFLPPMPSADATDLAAPVTALPTFFIVVLFLLDEPVFFVAMSVIPPHERKESLKRTTQQYDMQT